MSFDHDKERMLHELAEMRERHTEELDEMVRLIDAAQTTEELLSALANSLVMRRGVERFRALIERGSQQPAPCPNCTSLNTKRSGEGQFINYHLCLDCKETFNTPKRPAP